MNVIISGADGFIGKYLADYLKSLGYNVIGLVYNSVPTNNEYKIDVTNSRDFDKLNGMKCDVFIHSAGIVDQNISAKLLFETNAIGTKNALNWASKHAKHFIQMSSISVYGNRVIGQNRSEANTKRCNNRFAIPYARSKAKAEQFAEQSGMDYTILRLPAVIGKNDTYISKVIIPRLIDGTFFFCGNKNPLYSMLNIKNIGDIIDKIIRKGPQNRTFNCVDYHVTWRDFVNVYADSLSIDLKYKQKSIFNVLTRFRNKDFMCLLMFSRFGAHFPNDELKKAIDFTPAFHWKEGIEQAVSSYLKTNKTN